MHSLRKEHSELRRSVAPRITELLLGDQEETAEKNLQKRCIQWQIEGLDSKNREKEMCSSLSVENLKKFKGSAKESCTFLPNWQKIFPRELSEASSLFSCLSL